MTQISRVTSNALRRTVFCLAALSFLPLAGCIQFAANLMHVMSGPQVSAEFKGLDGKRVAIISNDESGICRDESTIRLAGNLKGILAGKLPKATFVRQDEIDSWLDGKSSREQDFVSIGEAVKADYLVSVEMLDLKLKDGQTLFRGRSNLTIRAWDIKASKIVFQKTLPEYTYPIMAGQATTETDETKFRRVYLMNVADKIGRYFYAHDFGEDVAIDATILQY